MGKLPLLDVPIVDYGEAEADMVRYREEGEARAAALGNRGPIRFDADGNITYKPGLMFTLQVHLIDKSHTRSLFLGDSYVITEGGAKCLNKVPPQMFRIK